MFAGRIPELLRDLLPLLPLPARRVQQDRSSLQAAPRLGLRKEAQFHSFSLCPGQAKSASSKPNYRAVGRAVPTSSEQKAVVSTRMKLLRWHPRVSPLSSTMREEGLTPDAAGSHRSSARQTRPLSTGTKCHVNQPCRVKGEPLFLSPEVCTPPAHPQEGAKGQQGLLLTRGFLTISDKPSVPVVLQFPYLKGRDKQLPTQTGSCQDWSF